MKRVLYIGTIDKDVLKNMFNAHFKKKFKFEQGSTVGEVTEMICSSGTFDLYFIDVDLKQIEPEQLWSDIIDLGGEKPVVFLGSKHILASRIDTNKIEQSMYAQLMERPFSVETFKEIMADVMAIIEKADQSNNTIDANEEDFFPMKLRSFYLHSRISFDAYAKITPKKYLKVIGKDQRYTISFLHNYLKRGVRFLYLKKDDRLKMLEQSVDQCKTILTMPELSLKKSLIIQGVGVGLVHEYIRLLGVCDNVLDLTALLGESIRKMNKGAETLVELFPLIDPTNKTVEGRSILTAYIADTILIGMGWSAELTRRKISLAAVIHDCFINDDVLGNCLFLDDPEVSKLDEKELKAYKEHAIFASEVARHFSDIPDVDFIVAQHHEHPKGIGFPRGMSGLQVTALSGAFVVAVHFATYITALGSGPQVIRKIMGKIREEFNQGNYRAALKSLDDTLKSIKI